jgi:raffinose/stachyose/melibiose transport system permease protein
MLPQRIRLKPGELPGAFSRHAVLLLLCLVALFPLYFMVSTAFKTRVEFYTNVLGPPLNPSLDNFVLVLGRKDFPRWFANSLILTITSTTIGLLISSMAAFAFSRMNFWGKRVLYNFMAALMAIPVIVTIIPLFVLMVNVQLINTYPAAIIIYIGFIVPYSTFLLTSFFMDVPQALIDCARLDGCSTFRIYWNIVMPLSAPAVITLFIVNALWVWNELLIALIFLQSDSLKTIMAGLTVFRSRFTVNIPAISAGLVVAIIPILLLYLVGQRYFIKGLIAGSLKGEVD